MNIVWREAAAASVAVLSVLGIIVLKALGSDIPPELAGVAGASTTWLFVHSSVQAEHAHADIVSDRVQKTGG